MSGLTHCPTCFFTWLNAARHLAITYRQVHFLTFLICCCRSREVWTPLEDYITNENYVQNT